MPALEIHAAGSKSRIKRARGQEKTGLAPLGLSGYALTKRHIRHRI